MMIETLCAATIACAPFDKKLTVQVVGPFLPTSEYEKVWYPRIARLDNVLIFRYFDNLMVIYWIWCGLF